jgi:hypothetical protein
MHQLCCNLTYLNKVLLIGNDVENFSNYMSVTTFELVQYSVLSYRLRLKNVIYHMFQNLTQILKAFYIVKKSLHNIPMQAQGRQRYSSNPFATQQQKEVGGPHHAPDALSLGRTCYPLYRRLDEPRGHSGWQ